MSEVESNGEMYDVGSRPISFYAYPYSLEKMNRACDLGDTTNITVSMYPHTEHQVAKYKLIKFVEIAALQVEQEKVRKLTEALEWYKDLPMSEHDQLWTQDLADRCIDVAKQALKEIQGDEK